ncbi:Gram-negative bacterial tonB protein [compost metagenome]
MKFNTKSLVLIGMLQLTCGLAFAQDTDPKPKSPEQQEKLYDQVDEPADFPGGRAALNKFLAENMRYPQNAMELGLQGKCYLQFIVTETGEITNIRVKKGVIDCPECDQEAIRLMKSMPKWIPAKSYGKNVSSLFTLPVKFKLN